ncbi:portal protein [Pleomorphomonas oryzae]|uniref:portal protein n=1 Tax=Pleomorphomonas oryzae TaxID=261934 RepID=UPI00041DA48A|nr:portal protein [Pleomorphomonas oryzae]
MRPSPSETQIQYHRRRLESLKSVRNNWHSTWTTLADFIAPQRLRLENLDERASSRKRILDPSGSYAWRTLKSGLHSGLTSPSRPWFRFGTPDPDLREWGPAKLWVDDVENIERRMFGRSNVYNVFHEGYGDLGLFGQSAALIVEGDDHHPIRMIQCLPGTYWISRNEQGVCDTLYRKLRWSCEKIVNRFGLTRVTQSIRSSYDRSRYDDMFIIYHAVEPRELRNASKANKKNKAFLSNYWADGASETDGLLEESGFDSNPIICPPWEMVADDAYAQSPAMDAIGDVKSLQAMARDKLEAIAKMVRPPMKGPTSLQNNPVSLLPGAITFVDDPNGGGLQPAMQVNLRISELMAEINETRRRIDTGFFADLFMMLQNMEGVQPRNVLEISERKEEKLLQLGPVLENIYTAQLEPVIELAFQIGVKRKMFPPPPPELQAVSMSVEYISTLAQAQKAVATGSVERLIGLVGQVASIKPEVVDKIDGDQIVDTYGEMVGAPAAIIVSGEKVKAIRDSRAQAQQQQAQAEMANKVAPAISAGSQAVQVAADAMNNPAAQDVVSRLGIAG